MLSEENSALIYPIVKVCEGELDRFKRVNVYTKESVLEDHMFQSSMWRGPTMCLKEASINLHVEIVVS